jgi:hypothetical protein
MRAMPENTPLEIFQMRNYRLSGFAPESAAGKAKATACESKELHA